MKSDIVQAHRHSSDHRREIEASASCGCFYCLQVFAPTQIEEWWDEEQTAVCPKCGIDSVIGDRSGYPLDSAFLSAMHKHWFE